MVVVLAIVKKLFGGSVKQLLRRGASFLFELFTQWVRLCFSFFYTEVQLVPKISNSLLLDSAMTLAEKIRTQQVSSEEVVKAFIERIREVNPTLNCLVEDRFSEALEEAREADQLISSGELTEEELAKDKPLLGVPFTTKDSIAVKGLHHTAGVVLRKDIIASDDAQSVAYIRQAGAIPLGLTNVPEVCMWWESNNKIYGRTNNPYKTNRTVGGSSGGEGCIQTVCGSAFGIGSDIGGSIRIPSCFNGIFGHKPSKFVVSIDGLFPDTASEFQSSFLGVGPMTKKASDLRPLLSIMAGEKAEQLRLDEEVNLADLKVYYQMGNANAKFVNMVEPAICKALMNAVDHLKSVTETTPTELKTEDFDDGTFLFLASMRIKDAKSFGEAITGKDDMMVLLFELVKLLFGASKNTIFGLLGCITEKVAVEPGTVKHKGYLATRQEIEDRLTEMLGENGVFLFPTHPTAALFHNESLFRPMNFCYTAIFNILGLPATHIPLGLNDEGLPVGIQVVSNFNNDRYCLAVAEELERAFGGWVAPPGK